MQNYRNYRARNTTFSEIPESQQEIDYTYEMQHFLDITLLLLHGKCFMKMLFHLKVMVNQICMRLY